MNKAKAGWWDKKIMSSDIIIARKILIINSRYQYAIRWKELQHIIDVVFGG